MFKILTTLLIGHVIILATYGNQMNTHQLLGACVAWSGLSNWCLWAFLVGAKPYSKNPDFKSSYVLAVISLVVGIILLPLMSLVNGRFPPSNLSDLEAAIALVGIFIALSGPLSPRVCNYKNQLSSPNMQQRKRMIKRKDSK